MSRSTSLHQGTTQSNLPGRPGAGPDSSPSEARHWSDRNGPSLFGLRVFSAIHYLQATGLTLGVGLIAALIWLWSDPRTYFHGSIVFLIECLLGAAFLGFLAISSFIIGNQLVRGRRRVFCVLLAVGECIWVVWPTLLQNLLKGHIDDLILGLPVFAAGLLVFVTVPIGIITAIFLNLPAIRALFRSNSSTPSF
jgi:hypothetical protein